MRCCLTSAMLAMADTQPGGRQALIDDIADLIAEKKYYTVQQVADKYQVSVQTIRGWTRDGKIRASFKLDQTLRYSTSDLTDFEQAQQKGEK